MNEYRLQYFCFGYDRCEAGSAISALVMIFGAPFLKQDK
jgi:hypothetical protein